MYHITHVHVKLCFFIAIQLKQIQIILNNKHKLMNIFEII